ncbi:hypothetical protein [Anaeromyxobacter terrae]|uniref:hypothetical protein n=1 Tax=Anaeromyxobacter terrae TaxID=2925406 RepID=UPI001F566AF6|nr:hypothetical protein [Anaeromyxobacter sp. SG22]
MSEEHDDFEPGPEDLAELPRDPMTDVAKGEILEHLAANVGRVFYSRQLEVLLERKFFHWVTSRAIRELISERVFAVEPVKLGEKTEVRFLVPKGVRYYKRIISGMAALVRRYSNSDFTRAIGLQGENLFLTGLAQRGFAVNGRDVKEYGGKKWIATKHDLDFVVARDGVAYGVEVKNTLPYIPRDELRLKVRMCEGFGIVPLMIMRSAPKSYIFEEIVRPVEGVHRGFALLFGKQIYPYGYDGFVADVVKELGLPVHAPRAVPEGDIDRFVRWHLRWRSQLGGSVNSK